MVRDIVKVRKVGQTLVVTLTQDILGEIPIKEGDRLLLEAAGPRRIILTRDSEIISSSHRLELELKLLIAQKDELETENEMMVIGYNSKMDKNLAIFNPEEITYFAAQQNAKIAKLKVEIAKKKIELFDIQGGDLEPEKESE